MLACRCPSYVVVHRCNLFIYGLLTLFINMTRSRKDGREGEKRLYGCSLVHLWPLQGSLRSTISVLDLPCLHTPIFLCLSCSSPLLIHTVTRSHSRPRLLVSIMTIFQSRSRLLIFTVTIFFPSLRLNFYLNKIALKIQTFSLHCDKISCKTQTPSFHRDKFSFNTQPSPHSDKILSEIKTRFLLE